MGIALVVEHVMLAFGKALMLSGTERAGIVVSSDRGQPKPRNRRIGARLRAIRKERTELSLEAAARLLGWSAATLSRTENGTRDITSEEVATMVTAYQLPPPDRDAIIQDARSVDSSGWWDRPLPGVPEEMGVLASYAAEANGLTSWAVALVPGLLQVEAYAMGLMLSDGITEEDAQLRWLARRRRQQILGAIDYTAYICETALRIPFGGRKAHCEQLEHLLGAPERGISVRILPDRRPHGLLSHSWLYMTFPSISPVVNVEVAEGGVYLLNEQARHYTAKLELLARVALSNLESSTVLTSIMREVR
ncbi:helix-turn-helix domain-containing protein [Actinophytocola sp.]|uniref:helix-turn-helix domain-containing protein n=1 Tax=Actinophytocola sp. TaxID=1872138 RepID=UPI003899DEDC